MSQQGKHTVVVGMSGGVDSSVSALLLKQQGYNVIGMFMKNWEEKDADGRCHSAQDYEDVVNVCQLLDIPYYSVNFSENYWEDVFSDFLMNLKAGRTPNPDILCNREIKFKVFLEKALEFGGDYLATGHYCQKNTKTDGTFELLKGADANKDQTYFLYSLKESILQKVLFPIGDLPKSEVRAIARQHHLPVSEKKDSTGICFIGKRNFKSFVNQYIAYSPGAFITSDGKEVGQHDGCAYYTIGQRKGLGIGGPGDAWFVVAKDVEKNTVTVVQGENHPALFGDALVAHDVTWINSLPFNESFRCRAKIRYRQEDTPCSVSYNSDGSIYVKFDRPQRAITPGQSIVFYDDAQPFQKCLGGAIISGFA